MPLTSADFVHPVGRVRSSFFPGENAATNLTAWVTAAYVKMTTLNVPGSSQDAIVKNLVYYRAFTSLSDVMLLGGNEYKEEETTIKFSDATLEKFGEYADEYLTAYLNALKALDTPVVDPEFVLEDSARTITPAW
jgi:hypothetical protein